jgi:hypothetical protein
MDIDRPPMLHSALGLRPIGLLAGLAARRLHGGDQLIPKGHGRRRFIGGLGHQGIDPIEEPALVALGRERQLGDGLGGRMGERLQLDDR